MSMPHVPKMTIAELRELVESRKALAAQLQAEKAERDALMAELAQLDEAIRGASEPAPAAPTYASVAAMPAMAQPRRPSHDESVGRFSRFADDSDSSESCPGRIALAKVMKMTALKSIHPTWPIFQALWDADPSRYVVVGTPHNGWEDDLHYSIRVSTDPHHYSTLHMYGVWRFEKFHVTRVTIKNKACGPVTLVELYTKEETAAYKARGGS